MHLSHWVLEETSFESLPVSSVLPLLTAAEVQTLVLICPGHCSGLLSGSVGCRLSVLQAVPTWLPEVAPFLNHRSNNILLLKDT